MHGVILPLLHTSSRHGIKEEEKQWLFKQTLKVVEVLETGAYNFETD
jgi:hypothetical protein